jgi:hypothetical protein
MQRTEAMNNVLALVAGTVGGVLGYFGFIWIARQGFYASNSTPVFQRLQFGSSLWHSALVFETNASLVTADADFSAVDIAAQRESSHGFPVAVAYWGELVEHRRRHGLFAWSRACHRLAG